MASSRRPELAPYRHVSGPTGNSIKDLRDTVNGVLDRGHLFGAHVQVTFPGAGTSVLVSSGLGGTITGYRVEKSNADVRVFDGTAPTGGLAPQGSIYLQASGAATVKLYLFTN